MSSLVGCAPEKAPPPPPPPPKQAPKPKPVAIQPLSFRTDSEAAQTESRYSRGQLLVQYVGHRSAATAVAFSRDGRMLATGGRGALVKVWDVTRVWQSADTMASRPLCDFRVASTVQALAFSPDGRYLACGSSDGLITVFDVFGKAKVAAMPTQSQEVLSVAFSSAGVLASGHGDGAVRLWNLQTKQPTAALKKHERWAKALAFSPDGARLASGSGDGAIVIWDVASRSPVRVIEAHRLSINDVDYSPDGRLIASGSNDNSICMFDAMTGKRVAELRGQTASVVGVRFGPSSKELVSASEDGKLRVWDTDARSSLQTMKTDHVNALTAMALSPDGRLIASAGVDKTVKLSPAGLPAVFRIGGRTIDWRARRSTSTSQPRSSIQVANAGVVQAGQAARLRVTVSNPGGGDLYRVKGQLSAPGSPFRGVLPLYFGRVPAGAQLSRDVAFQTGQTWSMREVPTQVTFTEFNGLAPKASQVVVPLEPMAPSRLTFAFRALDDGSGQSKGDGDGRIEAGEVIDIEFTISNRGRGPARQATLSLSPKGGARAIRLYGESATLGDIPAGGTVKKRVTMQVVDTTPGRVELALELTETIWNQPVKDTISLPFAR